MYIQSLIVLLKGIVTFVLFEHFTMNVFYFNLKRQKKLKVKTEVF